jgi:hypothetical protein
METKPDFLGVASIANTGNGHAWNLHQAILAPDNLDSFELPVQGPGGAGPSPFLGELHRLRHAPADHRITPLINRVVQQIRSKEQEKTRDIPLFLAYVGETVMEEVDMSAIGG